MQNTRPGMVTADDYRLLPEGGPRYQLVEGELCVAPAPNRYHQVISRNIQFLLMKYLERNPIGELYNAPLDVYLRYTDVFQPDLVFVSRAHFEVLTDAGIEGTPDLVVEILSPGNAALDRIAKFKVYHRTGVGELWMVDSVKKVVEVFHLQQDKERPAVYREGEVFSSLYFPGLTIAVSEIFKLTQTGL